VNIGWIDTLTVLPAERLGRRTEQPCRRPLSETSGIPSSAAL